MKLSQCARDKLRGLARRKGLEFSAGRFTVRLISPLDSLIDAVKLMYGDCELLDVEFADFTVRVEPPPGLRRWYRPQVRFSLNGSEPFSPLPRAHAYPLLEWGLNWCVSQHCHQYLIIHAAVLEKQGRALILPGVPGAGKSTLTAILSGRGGWRLLSDELALVQVSSGLLHPNPRPVSLKNTSIDIVRQAVPDAIFSAPVRDTLKGTVAHMRPSPDSLLRADEPAVPGLIVFPRYGSGQVAKLTRLGRGEAFMKMADNSFNYSILGVSGFETMAGLLDRCDCFEYPNGGDIDRALTDMDALIDG